MSNLILPASAALARRGPDSFRTMKMVTRTEGDVTPAQAEAEIDMARACAELLGRFYPGWIWSVTANGKQGVVLVRLPAVMRSTHCYCIHISQMQNYNDQANWMKRAGGEILERFRLPRSGFSHGLLQEARPQALISHKQAMPE